MWFLIGRREKRASQIFAHDSHCPPVLGSELLSQLGCSNSALFLAKSSVWLFSCFNLPSSLRRKQDMLVSADCRSFLWSAGPGQWAGGLGKDQTLTRNQDLSSF